MNKIGKMEGRKIPERRCKLSIEDQERLRKTVLKYYEVYINSKGDVKKIGEIITQILTECGLDIKDTNNRKKVSRFITQEMERLQRENKKPAKTIKSVILANNDALFNEYWTAKKLHNNKERKKRIKEIVSYILEEVGLEYNNLTIQRVNSFICSVKERRDKEERRKTGAEISASMKEDASKIKDVILENGYLITYYTCNYKDKGKIISDILKLSGLEDNRPNRKKVISKIHSMKYRTKTKEIFNQAVSKIVREGVRLDNANNKLNEQLNKQQTEEQDTISNVDKTYGIADTNETLPFFDDPFDDCENYPVL